MNRSRTYATVIIVLAVILLVALYFFSGGPEETESLTTGDEPAATANEGAGASDQANTGNGDSGAPATDDPN